MKLNKATLLVLGLGALAVLLALDLLNRGLIWQTLQSLRDETASGEKRSLGNQTEAVFLA